MVSPMAVLGNTVFVIARDAIGSKERLLTFAYAHSDARQGADPRRPLRLGAAAGGQMGVDRHGEKEAYWRWTSAGRSCGGRVACRTVRWPAPPCHRRRDSSGHERGGMI